MSKFQTQSSKLSFSILPSFDSRCHLSSNSIFLSSSFWTFITSENKPKPFALSALIGLVLHDGRYCRFINCSGSGTKTSFSSSDLTFITLVNFRFLDLTNLIVQDVVFGSL
jgi:hypothetical protein